MRKREEKEKKEPPKPFGMVSVSLGDGFADIFRDLQVDTVVDGANAVTAGNDIIMPGGPPVIKQILAGYQDCRVTRDALEKAVAHLLMALPEKPHIKERS